MGSRFILSGAGPSLTLSRNWLFVPSAMPRTTISTTTTARKKLRSGASSAVTCSKPNENSAKTINQNTFVPTATTLSFVGRSGKRLRSTNALMMTASTASRPSRNSIPMNGYYRRNEARSSNSAISTESIITNLRSLCTRDRKSRSSRLRKYTTQKTSSD